MARKRLNKKVAIIGSLVFAFFALGGIGVILYLTQNPAKFIQDGDVAMKAADAAADETTKTDLYKEARRNYGRALKRTKSDEQKIEILFKLVEVNLKTDEWQYLLGCWNTIKQLDAKNVGARCGLLKYVYIIAHNYAAARIDVSGVWKDIESQASEFLDIAEADILAADPEKFKPFGIQERASGKTMEAYLHLIKGRAGFQLAKMGAVTDPNESLLQAIDDLKKVLELEPDNVDSYWFLVQCVLARGELFAAAGNLEQKDKSITQIRELLDQAIEVSGGDVKAYNYYLRLKPILEQTSGTTRVSLREQTEAFEPDYVAHLKRFASSPQAFALVAGYYLGLGPKYNNKAIDAIEKACQLDPENVTYAITECNLRYRKFAIYGDIEELYKAIEIAGRTLTLPDAQETRGPRFWVNRTNRVALYSFLAYAYIEQAFKPAEVTTDSESQEWLKKGEEAVHEIEQLFGSGDSPNIIKWKGMLALAKGENKGDAVRTLYTAYEQLKAADHKDVELSYLLGNIFRNTIEIGATVEFMSSALKAGYERTRPELHLDMAEVLMTGKSWPRAISHIGVFEEILGPTKRSQMLRIKAYIGSNQFDDAEKELTKTEFEQVDTIKLNLALTTSKIRKLNSDLGQRRATPALNVISGSSAVAKQESTEPEVTEQLMKAEVQRNFSDLIEWIDKVLLVDPNSVSKNIIANICSNYVTEGKISQAQDFVERCLKYSPENTTALYYKRMLLEPEPANVSQERRNELEKELLLAIADPKKRALSLGVFYRTNNEPNLAITEFKKVLSSYFGDDEAAVVSRADDEIITISERLAISNLFEVALATENWEVTEQMVNIVQSENMDECAGNFFAARLAESRQEYNEALGMIEECLRLRPVFSGGYVLKSNLHRELQNDEASVEDAQKAARLNPIDGGIARILAFVLVRRIENLGGNVTSEQIIEAKSALVNAMRLNPNNLRLISFYSEFIKETDAESALAIRQNLQRVAPSMKNALLLGSLATEMAKRQNDEERKELLFGIAASAFEQAKAIDPNDRAMLSSYARYFRARGEEQKATQLLTGSGDQSLLWRHYFVIGNIDKAKKMLEELYERDPKNTDVLSGFILIADHTADEQAAIRYSEELLSFDDNLQNRLLQAQTYLKIGLLDQALNKLESLKEKYPDDSRVLLLESWLAMRFGQLKKASELISQCLQLDENNAVAWRVKGEINDFRSNYDQAIIDLRKSRSLRDDPVTRLALAKSYLHVLRIEDAVTELETIIELPQEPPEARRLLENVYFRTERYEQLGKLYEKTIRKLPDSVYWNYRGGVFAREMKQYKYAEIMFKHALELSDKQGKSDIFALYGYIESLIGQGQLDEAFEKAQGYADTDIAPIAYMGMAEVKMELNDKPGAIEYCKKALEKAGERAELVTNVLKRMYRLVGPEIARGLCKERLESNPDSLGANYVMYNITMANGEYNQAVSYIDKCIEVLPEDSFERLEHVVKKAKLLSLAFQKTSDNSYLKRSFGLYESILAEQPNNTGALNNLAYTLAANDVRLDEALKLAKRAHELRPNDPSLLDTYGFVLHKSGEYSEASEMFQRSVQQFEIHRIPLPWEVYEHLGNTKEKLGAGTEAISAYRRALELGADALPEKVEKRLKLAIELLTEY